MVTKSKAENRSVLYVATVVRTHIAQFHLPYLQKLKEHGWSTAVAARNDYSEPQDCTIPACDEYFDVPFERNPLKLANLRAYRALKKIIDTHEYDIIHVHTPVGALLGRLAARKSRKRGTKVIYTAHGLHFYTGAPLLNWLVYFPAEWVCSWLTDMLITINKEDYGRARRMLHAKNTAYVPGVGIDYERLSLAAAMRDSMRAELEISPESFALVSVGELIPRKNHRAVIQAMRVLKDQNRLEDVEYYICGSGSLDHELRALAEDLDVGTHIHLLGYRNDIPQILAACDAFVFPSLQEGLPIALLEAMAAGLPVICGKIRGNCDLVTDGKNGVVIERPNAQSIADAIELLRQNDEMRLRLGANAQESAKEYSVHNTVSMVEDLYKEVIGSHHAAPEAPRVAMLMPVGGSGGVQTVMSNLASGLDALGCCVSIVCCDNSMGLKGLPTSVEIIDLRKKRLRGDYKVALSMRAIRSYVSQAMPNVLITAPGFSGQVGVAACRGLCTKVLVMVDNRLSLLSHSSHKHRLFYQTAIRTYPRAEKIIFAHDAALSDFKQIVPNAPADKLMRIYHPLIPNDVSLLCQEAPPAFWPKGVPVVVAAGRLVLEKGFDTLVRAFAEVRANVACKLVILGEGELRESLESLSQELGISKDVLLPGTVDNVYACFSRSDVFVLSSTREAFGNVLVEALASGATCVATRCDSGGPQEILNNGAYGLLVQKKDPAQLAAAIESVLCGSYRAPKESTERGREFLVSTSADAYRKAIVQCL